MTAKKKVPKCEACGKPMSKITVDFEDHSSVMTAYECPEYQTLADLKTESIEELEVHGVSAMRFVKKDSTRRWRKT